MIQYQRGCDVNGRLSTGNALFPTPGDEVYDGEKQEGLVRCAMAGDLRVPVSAPVGPKLCEPLEVLLKHVSELLTQISYALLIIDLCSGRELHKIRSVPCDS